MEYRAIAKYIKVSPRKMRMLAGELRGKNADAVIAVLSAMRQHAARLLLPVVRAAVANAKVKNTTLGELRVKTIDVLEGPVAKRYHAVSRGMGHSYKKRMTHVRIIVAEEEKKKE